MSSQPKTRLTPEEYLAIERAAEYKNEYIDGEIVAMTGASRGHNLITVNIVGELRQQLKGRPLRSFIPAGCASAFLRLLFTPILM